MGFAHFGALRQHRVDDAVFDGGACAHEIVAFEILFDPLHRLARVLCHNFVQAPLELQHFLGVNADIRRLALKTRAGLVHHDARMRQRKPFTLFAAGEQQRAHARGLADADRRHVTIDELHRVVNRQTGRNRTAGRVDVEMDVLVRILGLEEQQLRNHEVRHVILDRTDDEYDPLLEQPGVDIVRPLAARGLLDDHRDQI